MNPLRPSNHILYRNDNSVSVCLISNLKRSKQIQKQKDHNNHDANNSNTKIRIYTKKRKKRNSIIKNNNNNHSLNSTNYNASPLDPRVHPKSINKILILMKKQEIKTHPLIKIIKRSLIDLPSPKSISF